MATHRACNIVCGYFRQGSLPCHRPAACAEDNATGFIALSTKGSSASSVGMPRFSTSSTM